MSGHEPTGLAAVLEPLAGAPEEVRLVGLAYVAGQDVEVDDAEVGAAIRRAHLLLATGGDPRRAVDLHGRAVVALADDLDAAERRGALQSGLAALVGPVAGRAPLVETLALLRADEHLAWRAYAAGLLADSLDDDA